MKLCHIPEKHQQAQIPSQKEEEYNVLLSYSFHTASHLDEEETVISCIKESLRCTSSHHDSMPWAGCIYLAPKQLIFQVQVHGRDGTSPLSYKQGTETLRN